jgi:hypothetical protein
MTADDIDRCETEIRNAVMRLHHQYRWSSRLVFAVLIAGASHIWRDCRLGSEEQLAATFECWARSIRERELPRRTVN